MVWVSVERTNLLHQTSHLAIYMRNIRRAHTRCIIIKKWQNFEDVFGSVVVCCIDFEFGVAASVYCSKGLKYLSVLRLVWDWSCVCLMINLYFLYCILGFPPPELKGLNTTSPFFFPSQNKKLYLSIMCLGILEVLNSALED